MHLDQLLTQIVMENDLDSTTVEQYKRTLKKFNELLGRPSDVSDLTVETVNRFIASLRAAGRSGTTCRNYKVSLTRVWNYAVRHQLAEPYCSARLMSPKIIKKPVICWTPDQVAQLVAVALQLPGKLRCGLPNNTFLAAYINVGYDTGLRPIDMRLLCWSNIDMDNGAVSVTQNKTKNPHVGRLQHTSIECLERIRNPFRDKVFPVGKGGMRKLELKLFALAKEMGFRRCRGQGLGTLRKTHATVIYERDGENAAAESLGHVGGTRTVRASYIDSRSIKTGRLPPPLPPSPTPSGGGTVVGI